MGDYYRLFPIDTKHDGIVFVEGEADDSGEFHPKSEYTPKDYVKLEELLLVKYEGILSIPNLRYVYSIPKYGKILITILPSKAMDTLLQYNIITDSEDSVEELLSILTYELDQDATICELLKEGDL